MTGGAKRTWLIAASILVLALGWVEDLYGLTDTGDVYGSDAVQYLDIARAIARHDWLSALNPLWSQGYPALLALLRPLFAAGAAGDWHAVRTLNFCIFALNYGCFLYLLFGLSRTIGTTALRNRKLLFAGGFALFVATQICFGQVSRVNPDELVTALLLLVCGLLVRMFYLSAKAPAGRWLLLGFVLGVGFVVKAVLLPIGIGILVMACIALLKQRRSLLPLTAAVLAFCSIAGVYGVALSLAVGKPTLGESGALNYAWHVNRLQKWVHWRGGVEPASQAWPKAAIARFAQWDTDPPKFGEPLHPDTILQQSPLVYGFNTSPVHATYVPYYDPPYWYAGYRHVFRWRYQVIALLKSAGDLVGSLLPHPMFYAMLLAFAVLLVASDARRAAWLWVQAHWMVVAIALLGFAMYLPVHLEGRYLAGFLLLLGLCGLAASGEALTPMRFRVALTLILLGAAGDLIRTQRPVWHNLRVHRRPIDNTEWRMGNAVLAQALPAEAPVGVIAWTPNLHCDWAYIAHVRIVSEIGNGKDFDAFWQLPDTQQATTLAAFRKSGAVAVFVNGMPAGAHATGWKKLAIHPCGCTRLERACW